MPFVRISVTYPRSDVRDEVRRHFEELIYRSQTLPGFVSAYALVSADANGGLGRVTVWDSHEAANRAANDPRIMATHAKLHFDTDGQIQEFDMDAPLALIGGVQTAS